MDSSDFLSFLSTRSSVRDFSDEPLTEEQIASILRCAGTAPSAGNRESWDVIIVTDEGLREDLSDAAFQQEHVMAAPVILVVCANYVRSMSQYGERGILYAIEDASIAATYMMLAAHAGGMHSCWTGAFDEEGVSEILGLPPHIRPLVLLAVGKGTLPPVRTGRMPITDHVHENIW
ncbi:nitroreductase [Methanomicrobiaceae archaeon CYW5]|uniref:nitroreductase family protein n=1 Tax=Methanovulcanius yangii TaxID=1789227 RepID=UPI0029CA25E8|nr:nitroreductase family protein [Methanovulcanius yangii]MBT8507963.1 nitroreductase [Methanovulcanius yangii]